MTVLALPHPDLPADLHPSRAALGAARLWVDHDRVGANTRRLATATTGELIAVVKADGFGLGAAAIARTALANGATRLGVTGLGEATALRRAGLRAPMLSWLHPVDADFGAAIGDDIEIAVPSLAHLRRVAATAPGARIHLQVDTGMARDGAPTSQWTELMAVAADLERSCLVRVVGLMGHLPCAGDPFDVSNAVGRVLFTDALGLAWRLGLRPTLRHLAATEATLLDPLSHHTASRCGAGIVGAAGSLPGVATLTAPLIEVRVVEAGTPVGYGQTWRAPTRRALGLLGLGYADGLPRVASGSAEVLVGRRRRPIVGRISMDMSVIDLGAVDRGAAAGSRPPAVGTEVTVFGPGGDLAPTIHDWAAWSQTLPHEVLTGIGARVERVQHLAGARR